ncbi:MAG: hydantoinase/oxoprolinase family protein, partial [Dehalococcoidia bacterium]
RRYLARPGWGLDPEEAEATVERLAQEGVESVAVCFLFSFLNPQHERLVAAAARRRRLFVSASCELLPEYREYERTSTTVVNAYVSPVMSRYLLRLEDELRAQGINRLRVMQSNGGSMGPQAAGAMAVRTVLSGPAGGVTGAFALAQQAGFDQVITFDMGGTSTDVSLCPGRILEQTETDVGGLPVRTPVVDVHSIGAGGGSIARIDEGGALRVGPQSVGADPGPACYGNALTPAVTDAQVVLGRIVPEHFLGGRMKLYPQRSEEALAPLAPAFGGDPSAPLRAGVVRAAASVVRVANANMERAIRVISVERGYDPRLFALLAFGGAGPLHACELAQALGIPRVLVPPFPGVLSAFGMVAAAPTRDFSQAAMAPLPPQEGEEWERAAALLGRLFGKLRQRATAEMEAEGFARRGAWPSAPTLMAQAFLDMRYLGQSYELTVPVEGFSPTHVLPRFHAAHQERYGHSDPSRTAEVVNVRLKLTAATEKPTLPELTPADTSAEAAAIAER